MSLMLKQGIEVLVGVALVAAMLAVLHPAVAEAQSMSATQDDVRRGTNRDAAAAADAAPAARVVVVVRPGDSLWSISEERLGPNATPQQIEKVVERIYALNRSQIGADPNLIFPGQKLVAPPVAGATPARNATEPAQKDPTARATERASDRTSNPTVGEAAPRKAAETANAAGERAHLPDMARPAPVPAVRPLTPGDTSRPPGGSLIGKARAAVSAVEGVFLREGYTGRRLLGVALLAGSCVLALVLARYLARELGARGLARRRLRDARAKKYYYAATFGPHLFDDEDKRGKTGEEEIPTADPGSGAPATDIFASARRRARRLRRPARPQGPPGRARKRLATGALSPGLRRLLRRRRVGRQ